MVKDRMKRGLAMLLAVCMVLSMLTTGALAKEPVPEDPDAVPVCAGLEGCTEADHSEDCPLYVPPEDGGESGQGDDITTHADPAGETHIATYVGQVPEALEGVEGITADTFAEAYKTVKVTADDTEYTVEVVPKNLVYFIDQINYDDGTVSKPYEAVKTLIPDLLNDKYDQKSDGSDWGLVSGLDNGKSSVELTDKDATGIFGKNGAGNKLVYALKLPAGKYTITTMHQEWWGNQNRTMDLALTIGGKTETYTSIPRQDANQKTQKSYQFDVQEEQVVTLTITATTNQGPAISWLGVVRDGDATPEPPKDPAVRPTLPEGYDKPVEDNNGLTLTEGAVLTEVTGFDKMLVLSSDWDNQNKNHANINDVSAFKSGSFTVLMDVNVAANANEKASILSIGTPGTDGNSLRLFQKNGNFGYGPDIGGNNGGLAQNQATLTGVQLGDWNCVAMTYEEKDGGNGSVTVYVNGQKAGEVADVGFKLSEQADLTAMVGRSFNTSFMPTGRYDNLVIFDQVLDGETLCQETAWRLEQKLNPPIDVASLEKAIAKAEAVIAAGMTNDALTAALAKAKEVLNNQNHTQMQVDAACEALIIATPGLGEVIIKGSDIDAAAENINGLTYKGFGMLNGNSTSNLLLDYKAESPDAYWDMMEYLFGGEHPIFTHIKMEMGNDGNNSTGAEACTMRYEDDIADASRSPGFVMAADAKKINPDVKVSILRWEVPNWVKSGSTFDYEKFYTWYRETIFDAYEKYGYVVDFVNPDKNETGTPDDAFIKWFANRVATENDFPDYFTPEAKAAYNNIRIIASDENKGLKIVPHMRADEELYEAVDIIGFHYRSDATPDYITMADVDDKEVWYSEGCATFSYSEYQENKNLEYGAGTIGGYQTPVALMDHFIASFEGSRRTHYIFQPAIGSFYEGIQYGHKELLSARDPWSGYIHYDPALYMLEHFTKFAELGWENADNTAGIWRAISSATKGGYTAQSNEHATAGIDGNAGYLTLAAPDKKNFSVVFVNNTRGEKLYTITAEGLDVPANQQLAVWTTVTDSYLQKTGTVDCADGTWTIRLPAYSVVTATTLTDVTPERAPGDTTQGKNWDSLHNEDRTVLDTDSTGRKADTTDEYLYADDFDYASYEKNYMADRGNEPRYMLDTHSAWIVEDGKLKQELNSSVGQWNGGDPCTIVGDFRWMDYSASADVIYPEGAADGAWAGIGIRSQTGMNWNNSGYTLHIQKDGAWNLYRIGTRVASGTVEAKDSYHLTLMGLGSTITALVDGNVVASYSDPSPMLSGRVKFSSGWNQVYFDNFEVKTVSGGIPYALSMIDNQDDSVTYEGSWDIGSSSPAGGSADDWYRSLSKSKAAGASLTFTFYGTGFALTGNTGSGVQLDVYVDNKLVGEGVSTAGVPNRYEAYILSDLELGSHTAKIVVKSGTLILDAIHFLGERLEADPNAVVSVAPVTLPSAMTEQQIQDSLPDTVEVTLVSGEKKTMPVTWTLPTREALENSAFRSLIISGKVDGVKSPAGVDVMASAQIDILVPSKTVYYIDTVTGLNGTAPDTTEPYEAVKTLIGSDKLLNEKYDQLKTDENTWGLVDRDAGTRGYNNVTTDPIATGIYGAKNEAGETLTYSLTLPAGNYILYSAHREWWNMNRPMTASLKIGSGEAADAGTIKLSGSSGDQWNQVIFTVPADDTVVEYTVTATGTEAPVISLLAVTKDCDHIWDEGVVTKAPTSSTAGVKTYTCTICGRTRTESIPATGGGSSSGGSTGGRPSSGSTGGSSGTSSIVTTGNTNQSGTTVKETTARPKATTKDDTATAKISDSVGSEIIKQAVDNESERVVIAPDITGNVTQTEVSIPASTLEDLGSKTSASLTVSTPVAEVAIPNGGLSSLGSAGGTVTVSAEHKGSTVELSVTAGGTPVEHIPGGVTLTVPVKDAVSGTVAVLIHDDGTKEVVRKSVASDGSLTIPLNGSAKLQIVDNSKQFDDVPANSWAASAVSFVSSHELFNGTGNGQFSPEQPMTRGMLAVVLHNLENNPQQAFTDTFHDVADGTWYSEAVSWAAERGIVTGYSDGSFGHSDNITREQLAVILWRYVGSPAAADGALQFTDAENVSSWAEEAMRWAVEVGVLNGKGSGILDPGGFATRAETAQMLKNFMEAQ